jgi:hypothetical protein
MTNGMATAFPRVNANTEAHATDVGRDLDHDRLGDLMSRPNRSRRLDSAHALARAGAAVLVAAALSAPVHAQSLVKGTIAFQYAPGQTAGTPDEACRKWVKANFPTYSFVSVYATQSNDRDRQVSCSFKDKTGDQKEQVAVLRVLICPAHSQEAEDGIATLDCACDQSFAANGRTCVPDTDTTAVAAGDSTEDHHIFPKQFEEQFRKLFDAPGAPFVVDAYTVTILKENHRGADGVHRGDNFYNKEWEDFFSDERVKPTKQGACKLVARLLNEAGLAGPKYPIHYYRKPSVVPPPLCKNGSA